MNLRTTIPNTTIERPGVSSKVLLAAIIPIHFLCFYWWTAHTYYFTGDSLFYFSRQIESLSEFIARFTSLDELYQYRPLTYVVFTFVLFPLFGNSPHPYHVTAYLFSAVNLLLACACAYYWSGKSRRDGWFAAIFLALNPVHFFVSFGPTFIDQWLSSLFYYGALLFLIAELPYSRIAAPAMFLFALFSKEHSVLLPVHVVLIFYVLGVPFRDVLRRTRAIWVVLAAFVIFQLWIRHGAVFAPPDSNANLQFSFSTARLLELAKGLKPAIFYPENYSLDGLFGAARWIRLAVLFPIAIMMLAAVRRRPRLALSGLLWVCLSLLPVAFLRQPPSPRHYCLGITGLAVVFAAAVPSWRVLAVTTSVLSVLTITDVELYARESWIAKGAQQTKAYVGRINEMLRQTGKSSFYVASAGDPYFYWHVDGGAAISILLRRDLTFRFSSLQQPLEVDQWLTNRVNVILPHDGNITDMFQVGQFPPRAHSDVCVLVRKLTHADTQCSILFRGEPVIDTNGRIVETPNGLPIFEVAEGVVTLSRTTIRIPAAKFALKRTVRVVPESVDGVVIDLYGQRQSVFTKLLSQRVLPGESRELDYFNGPDELDYVVIRIHPGSNRDEQRDWVVWES